MDAQSPTLGAALGSVVVTQPRDLALLPEPHTILPLPSAGTMTRHLFDAYLDMTIGGGASRTAHSSRSSQVEDRPDTNAGSPSTAAKDLR